AFLGTSAVFGRFCGQVAENYQLFLLFDQTLLNLLIPLLLSIALIAVAASLLALFARPFWVIIVSSIISAVIIFLNRPEAFFGAICAAYALLTIAFAGGVSSSLNNQFSFSTKPVGQHQKTFFWGLILLIAAGFTIGYQKNQRETGFIIPAEYREKTIAAALNLVSGQLEGQNLLGVQKKLVENELSKRTEEALLTVEKAIEPYGRYIPYLLGVLLASTLSFVLGLLGIFIPRIVGSVVFLLRITGFLRTTTEMKEVRKLML
ncbi:MAG: hypothetical protein Q8N98_00820, partial [bacterium]|nr:hypothetical protein [bacterium]